jgi:hypothetical protein
MKRYCPSAKIMKDACPEYAMYADMHDLDLSLHQLPAERG